MTPLEPKTRQLGLKPFALFVIIIVLGATLLGMASVGRAIQVQWAYDAQLSNAGIDPTLAGVERFIRQKVQLGTTRNSMLDQLAILCVVGHSGSATASCEDIRIFLFHRPGDKLPLFVPPDTPPIYDFEVCYDHGIVERVGELRSVADINQ
jgi:hypothetical protein